ncbi:MULTISPECIES: hypothetical protein, partial [unclassified Sphingopyxis]
MMASLPQTPAHHGLASILAALGTAAPANESGVDGGFGQLLANMPTATSAAPVAANLFGAQTPVESGAPAALPVFVVSADADRLPTPATTPAT